MSNQRNIIGTGDHQKLIKQFFPGYESKVNPGYTHKDQYFDKQNIDKFGFRLTKPKMLGTTAYEVPAQAALDSLYSADYLKKYTPKVQEVNARRAKLNTNLSPISPYFNVLLPDTDVKFDKNLIPLNEETLTSMTSSAYLPLTQSLNFGVHEAADGGTHSKFLDSRYNEQQHSGRWAEQNGFYPVLPDFSKSYTNPQQVFKSFRNHELGHFANHPSAGEGTFDLIKNNKPSSFYNKYFATPEGSTYGKYMLYPEIDTRFIRYRPGPTDPVHLRHGTYNQVPGEFYNFLGQVKRWGPKFGIEGTMDTSDMTKHRQAMKDTVNHIMNLKPEDIDDTELLRAHNYLNTAKKTYPRSVHNQDEVRDVKMENAYNVMADSIYSAKLRDLGIEDGQAPNINEHTYNNINQSLAFKGQPIVDTWIPYRKYKAIDGDVKNYLQTSKNIDPLIVTDTPAFIEALYPALKDKYSKEDLIKYFKFQDNYNNFHGGLKDERRNRVLELMEKDPMNFKNMQDLNQHNPQEVIPSMILDQVSDDDLRALVNNRRSSSNNGALRRLMYS